MAFKQKQIGTYYFSTLLRFASNPTMIAIRNGLLLALPLVMAGSIALLINHLPIPAYQQAMSQLFGENWQFFGLRVWQATFGVLALLMNFSISQHLVTQYNLDHPIQPLSPVIAALVSFASLIVIIPINGVDQSILMYWTGSGGLFVSILVALISTKLFLKLSQLKPLQITLHAEGADTAIPQAFSALFPGIITVFIFGLFQSILYFFDIKSVHELIHQLILWPFTYFDDTFESGAVYIFVSHLFWFFGIHGPNVLDPVTHQFYETAMNENIVAAAAGLPIPHIVNKIFLDVFVFMGGAGSSVCLLLAIFIGSKNNSNRRLAHLSVLPGIFNINEMLLFGLPVILNPLFLIPFLLVPLLLGLISYIAISGGLVPGTITEVSWTTPPLIGGYIATGSIAGTLLQCFNLSIGTLCYIPFVRFSDRIKTERFKIALDGLLKVALSNTVGPSGKKCLDRDDEIGVLARALANDLRVALKNNREVFVVYQPQVDYRTDRVVGVEALIRWEHPGYGLVPPPIMIAIAEDGDFINDLGLWVFNEASAERKRWLDMGLEDIQMSVNLSVKQLEDRLLPQKILRIIHRHDLPISLMELEVTESVALTLNQETQDNIVLNRLHETGIRIAIDDFGMGHSSLVYLKHFPVNTLKLDRALSKDVAHSKACFEIITTIVDLCKAMNVDIVTEFVENKMQIDALTRLGCYIFQGYYFSAPKKGPDCLTYILNKSQQNRLIEA